MAGKVTSARAYANNEVALIAWDVDGFIDGCLGFDIVRIMDGEPPKGMAAWVPFEGQENPTWTPQDTGVWPVQRLYWRDLTVRRHRSDSGVRDTNFEVRYQIRPVGDMQDGLEPVPVRQPKAYEGPARPLGYLGPVVETDPVEISADRSGAHVTFTNGILSAQWLKHAFESAGKPFTKQAITQEIADSSSPIRGYLTGDVLATVSSFLRDPKYQAGTVRLALYELSDDELIDLLIQNRHRIEVILSNSSKDGPGKQWDYTNRAARKRLVDNDVQVHNRLFNNNHIGHNKFAVWNDGKRPRAVMSGSTNWTPNGLCAQSNNALIIEDDAVAKAYSSYWEHLLADELPALKPMTANGTVKQVQGPDIRTENITPDEAGLNGGARAQIWFSPNTEATRKGEDPPPDLKVLFDLMAEAEQAILMLAFLPSRAGLDSIISTAIALGKKKPELMVLGAISDVTAMPGYKPPDKTSGAEGNKPYTYDNNGVHIVRAAYIKDMVGAFEKEQLGLGHAIVHDKIVVIDPLSDNCVVATGSHNLGFKASYENDENLLIVRNNRALAEAYAVHVLDVYDHYRFRAWQAKLTDEGKPLFDGHIQASDQWLRNYLKGKTADIARYFSR